MARKLKRALVVGGQFNGGYNVPASVGIYRGTDTSTPIKIWNVPGSSSVSVIDLSESPESDVADTDFLFVFNNGTSSLSILELQVFGE